jgi:hypothetical protein
MPLLLEPNQPYFPDPNLIMPRSCDGVYQFLLQPGDEFKAQFYQTPCNANAVSDPNFADITQGSELIVNGDWVSDPVGAWTYDVGLVHWAYNPAEIINTFTQPSVLTAGLSYQLEFTISGLTSGNFLYIFLGSTNQTIFISQNGDYSLILLAGSDNTDLAFQAVSVNFLFLSGISLKEYSFSGWDLNGNWQINDGVACAVGGTTGALQESVSNYILSGEYWQLTFTVSGMTQGTVTPYLANMAGTAISSNGTYTIYKTAGADGVVKFVPSANFDGCISLPDARKLKNDYEATLYLNEDSYDISSYFEYYNQYVTLNYNPDDDDLPYGCFTVEILDSCTVQFDEVVSNGEFAGGAGNVVPDWTKNNDATMYNFDGINCKFIRSSSGQTNAPILKNVQNVNLVAGNYEIEFEIISNTDTLGIGATIGLDGAYFGAYFTTVGVHTFTISGYDPNNPLISPINLQRVLVVGKFNVDGAPHTGEIVVDNVSVRRVAPFDATYTSETVNYRAEHTGSVLIQAYSDQDAYGLEFENTGFVLQQRMLAVTWGAVQDKNKNVSTSGSGNRRLNYSESMKVYQFTTEWLSDTAHSCFSAQLDMDHLLIGTNIANLKEYVANPDSYTPEWREDYNLATTTVQLTVKDGAEKYNRHVD